MIVKCERLFNENTKKFHPGPSNRGLTIGNFYSVLEIYYEEEEVLYRLFDDLEYEFQIPFLTRSDQFSIVSGRIPSNWELIKKDSFGKLSPKIWNVFEPWEESFWQDWYNHLPKAKQCFDNELKIIFDCDAEWIKIIDEQQNKKPYFSI